MAQKGVKDLKAGDHIPSNFGTFTVGQVERRGSRILAFTKEKLPDDTYCITFAYAEVVEVEED